MGGKLVGRFLHLGFNDAVDIFRLGYESWLPIWAYLDLWRHTEVRQAEKVRWHVQRHDIRACRRSLQFPTANVFGGIIRNKMEIRAVNSDRDGL